jgi:hypothetical protein
VALDVGPPGVKDGPVDGCGGCPSCTAPTTSRTPVTSAALRYLAEGVDDDAEALVSCPGSIAVEPLAGSLLAAE